MHDHSVTTFSYRASIIVFCLLLIIMHLQAVSKAAYLMMYARLGVDAQRRSIWPDWSGSLVTPTYVFGKLEGAAWDGHVAGRRWDPPVS